MEKLWSNCGGTPSRGTDGTLSLQKKVKIVSLHGLENAFLRNLLQLNFCASSAIEHGNKCWLNRRWITMKSRIKKTTETTGISKHMIEKMIKMISSHRADLDFYRGYLDHIITEEGFSLVGELKSKSKGLSRNKKRKRQKKISFGVNK